MKIVKRWHVVLYTHYGENPERVVIHTSRSFAGAVKMAENANDQRALGRHPDSGAVGIEPAFGTHATSKVTGRFRSPDRIHRRRRP